MSLLLFPIHAKTAREKDAVNVKELILLISVHKTHHFHLCSFCFPCANIIWTPTCRCQGLRETTHIRNRPSFPRVSFWAQPPLSASPRTLLSLTAQPSLPPSLILTQPLSALGQERILRLWKAPAFLLLAFLLQDPSHSASPTPPITHKTHALLLGLGRKRTSFL